MSRESSVCNGPLVTGMYAARPYYDDSVQLELPSCMYRLSSVYGNEVTQPQTNMTSLVSAWRAA